MNTARIIEVSKKNAFSIAAGVVAILAIVATQWPVSGMFTTLQGKSDQRAALYSQLESLRTKERKLPLTDPSKTQQDDLNRFPNQKTIDLGQNATKAVSDQSVDMVKRVQALNQKPHTLLVADALPNPLSDTPRFRFGDLYKLVLSTEPNESIQSDPKLQNAKQANLWNDILHAGVPPTDQTLTDAKNKLWTDTFEPRIIKSNGQAINEPQIKSEYDDAAKLLPDQLKGDVAKQRKIYAAVDSFTVNQNVIGVGAPNPVDIWYAQQMLWVQQDVAQALAEANANSKNILDAPVKHLVKLVIPPALYTFQSSQQGSTPQAPAPVEGSDTAPVPRVFTVSPTGRVSNPMYDVVQFTLVINVDASQIPQILRAFVRNRLMDVYNMDVLSVDSDDARLHGYIYGSMPVVQLVLHCESLYMRQWTTPMMPDNVKKQIGVAVAAAPGAAPTQ